MAGDEEDTLGLHAGADAFLQKVMDRRSFVDNFWTGLKITSIALSLILSIYAAYVTNHAHGPMAFSSLRQLVNKQQGMLAHDEDILNVLNKDHPSQMKRLATLQNQVSDLMGATEGSETLKQLKNQVRELTQSLKSSKPMFDCYRTSRLSRVQVVNYDGCFVDTTGGAMSSRTGAFNVTIAGIYQISFTAKYVSSSKGQFGAWSDIYVNRDVVADSQREYKGVTGNGSEDAKESSTHTMMLLHPLHVGDVVKVVFNKDGSSYMHSDNDHDVHFTARLVQFLPGR